MEQKKDEQQAIEQVREFRDERENQIALANEEKLAVSGEKSIPEMNIESISYYPNFKLPLKSGGYLSLQNVYVEEMTVDGKPQRSLYANGQLQMVEKDGEMVINNLSLAEMVDLQALDNSENMENMMIALQELNSEELQVVSETVENADVLEIIEEIEESEVEVDEAAEIAEEAENEEEVSNKLDLGIIPSKTVRLKREDVKDIPELKGGNKIEYTYSRKMNGWVVLKDGELAMGPARTTTETMYSVDEYGNKEVSTESPHATIRSKDPTKKIAFSYGQYGEVKADKVFVNRDGTQLKRKIDSKGHMNFDKTTKEEMDHLDETEQITDNYETNRENDDTGDKEYDLDRVNDEFNLETVVYLADYGSVTLEYVMKNILKLSRTEEFLEKVEEAPGSSLEDKVQEVIDEIEQEFHGNGGRSR